MPFSRHLIPGLVTAALGVVPACAAPRGAAPPPLPVQSPLAAGGGGGTPVPPAAAPAATPVAVGAEAFSPSGAAAERYGADAGGEAPADPLRSVLLADVSKAAREVRTPTPHVDARLNAVADDLARALSGEKLPTPELVDFLLNYYGIVEPAPNLVYARCSPGGEDGLREGIPEQLRPVLKTGAAMQLGAGVFRGAAGVQIVVALQEHHVELESVPRVLPAGGNAIVAGRLLGAFREPHFSVTGPDGRVEDVPARLRAGRFEATIQCHRGNGPYQVELNAVGRGGALPVANFPVFCGVPAPRSLAGVAAAAIGAPLSPADAEKTMLRLVNQDRAAAGLPPLEWDEKLAAVARAHGRDMSEHRFVGHTSPTTGDPLDRVQRAGINPPLMILENVARAYTVEELQRGLMASPAHRANILDRRARRLGIGIVAGKEEGGLIPLYATQLFM